MRGYTWLGRLSEPLFARQKGLDAPMDRILTFVSGAIERVQEMKEKERSANLINALELMQAKKQGEGKAGDE